MKTLIAAVALLGFAFWLGGYHLVWKPSPDQLYGCTIKQQDPNGDCP